MARRKRPNGRFSRPTQAPAPATNGDEDLSSSEPPTPRDRRSNRPPNHPFNDTEPLPQGENRKRLHSNQNMRPSISKAQKIAHPGIAHRHRVLKTESEYIKSKLEQLITLIDELQPDGESMDWAISPGTIMYVPVPRAEIIQPEIGGMAPWSYLRGPLKFTSINGEDGTVRTDAAQPQAGDDIGNIVTAEHCYPRQNRAPPMSSSPDSTDRRPAITDYPPPGDWQASSWAR